MKESVDNVVRELLRSGNDDLRLKHIIYESPIQSEFLNNLRFFLKSNSLDDLRRLERESHEKLIANRDNQIKLSFQSIVAAAIVVGVVVFAAFNLMKSNNFESSIYDKYYEREIGFPMLLNEHKETTTIAKGFEMYKVEKYEDAIKLFNNTLTKTDTLSYFSGCSYLELSKWGNAIKHFKMITITSEFKEKADYRLALCFLMEGRDVELNNMLSKILRNREHRYYDKAKSLRLDLKK